MRIIRAVFFSYALGSAGCSPGLPPVKCVAIEPLGDIDQIAQCVIKGAAKEACHEPLSLRERRLWSSMLFGYEVPKAQANDKVDNAVSCSADFIKLIGSKVVLRGFSGRVPTGALNPDRTSVWLPVIIPAASDRWFGYNKNNYSLDISKAKIVRRDGQMITVTGFFRSRGGIRRDLANGQPPFMITEEH